MNYEVWAAEGETSPWAKVYQGKSFPAAVVVFWSRKRAGKEYITMAQNCDARIKGVPNED